MEEYYQMVLEIGFLISYMSIASMISVFPHVPSVPSQIHDLFFNHIYIHVCI